MLRRRPLARMAVGTAVVAGTAGVVGGRVARRQEAMAPEPAPAAAPAPPPAAAAAPDPVAQLKDLAALKDSGALTEAEFETEKAKILG